MVSTRHSALNTPPTKAEDKTPSGPIYSKIHDYIQSLIDSGDLKTGDRLPSESQLAKQFETTRVTVRQALTRLVFEGAITRHVGRGSFVAPKGIDKFPIDSRVCLCFEDQVAVQGKVVTYRAPSLEIAPLPPEAARMLALPPGIDVFKMERLRMLDGRPICFELRYIPLELGNKVTGEMLMTRSAYGFLSEILGFRIPTIRVLVSAVIADARLSDKLEVPKGSALLLRDNVHLDMEGQPLMCGGSYFRGDIRTEYVLGHDPNPLRLPE